MSIDMQNGNEITNLKWRSTTTKPFYPSVSGLPSLQDGTEGERHSFSLKFQNLGILDRAIPGAGGLVTMGQVG